MWSFCLVGVFAILLSSPTHGSELASSELVKELIWQFGDDVGKVSFSAKGETAKFKMATRVYIVLPKCHKLTFVRVTIDNSLSKPVVDLDRERKAVTIYYRRFQPYNPAIFKVIAKSIPGDCSPEQIEQSEQAESGEPAIIFKEPL